MRKRKKYVKIDFDFNKIMETLNMESTHKEKKE